MLQQILPLPADGHPNPEAGSPAAGRAQTLFPSILHPHTPGQAAGGHWRVSASGPAGGTGVGDEHPAEPPKAQCLRPPALTPRPVLAGPTDSIPPAPKGATALPGSSFCPEPAEPGLPRAHCPGWSPRLCVLSTTHGSPSVPMHRGRVGSLDTTWGHSAAQPSTPLSAGVSPALDRVSSSRKPSLLLRGPLFF